LDIWDWGDLGGDFGQTRNLKGRTSSCGIQLGGHWEWRVGRGCFCTEAIKGRRRGLENGWTGSIGGETSRPFEGRDCQGGAIAAAPSSWRLQAIFLLDEPRSCYRYNRPLRQFPCSRYPLSKNSPSQTTLPSMILLFSSPGAYIL